MSPIPTLWACIISLHGKSCSAEQCFCILRLRPCRWPLYFGLLFLVGSLVFGCSFDVTCFPIHSDLGRGRCWFWFPKRVILVCLVRPLLAPWGTIKRSRGTWKKGDLGIRHRILRVICKLWSNICVFFMFASRLRFFRLRGLSLDVWGLETSIRCRMRCKRSTFAHWAFVNFGVIFNVSWWLLKNWRFLVPWRQAWNLMVFDGFPGGLGAGPVAGVMVVWRVPGPY